VLIDVLRNDNDREGDSIFIKGYSQPADGCLNIVANKFVYYPKVSSATIDSFQYVINDGMNNSDSVTVEINVKDKNDPCYPWLSCDIGNVNKPGNFSCMKKSFFIEASGSDIWNNVDEFRYAYQYVSGDCEIYAKVESLEGTNEWAKAGLMVRESLNGNSRCAFVCVSNKNGIASHQRVMTGESMEGNGKSEIKAPYWIKLVRKGNSFSYLYSADGSKWKTLGSADVIMDKKVYIGFAVTSHNNNEMCKAVYSNYKLTAKNAKL
jgi:hypothetical protein